MSYRYRLLFAGLVKCANGSLPQSGSDSQTVLRTILDTKRTKDVGHPVLFKWDFFCASYGRTPLAVRDEVSYRKLEVYNNLDAAEHQEMK